MRWRRYLSLRLRRWAERLNPTPKRTILDDIDEAIIRALDNGTFPREVVVDRDTHSEIIKTLREYGVIKDSIRDRQRISGALPFRYMGLGVVPLDHPAPSFLIHVKGIEFNKELLRVHNLNSFDERRAEEGSL